MKKFLFALIMLVSTGGSVFAIIIPSFIQQTQYRWRNDDGNETTATWKAANNTPINVTDTTSLQRLRLKFRNNSGGAFAVNQTLEYSSNGGGAWTAITNAATNEFWYQPSAQVANGLATTNQMGAATAGTFAAGKIVSAPAAAVNLANNGKTEYEWVIKPTSNIEPFKTYTFRTSNQGSTPVNYGQLSTGCVGVITAGTLNAGVAFVDCNGTTTLTLTGNTVGAVNFKWQYDNGTGWINFGPNANNTVTPGIILDTRFRCIVSCAASPDRADTTTEVMVVSLPLIVDLGNDINQCLSKDQFVVLDAGVFPNNVNYSWDDGSTRQVKSVNQSGTYIVRVTDQFTCSGADTINVIVRENPIVDLGSDTSICNEGTLVLDAGPDGIDYSWNTGATTRTIEANGAGTYVTFVTNDEGCKMSDTFNLSVDGEFPSIQGIAIHNNGERTFYFTAVNPANVIGYDWDFGDGQSSNQTDPTHTYADSKSYIVVLRLTSTCGFRSDSTSVHILGINQIDVDNRQLSVFPNPARDAATILNRGNLKMKEIVVYNLSGQIVHKAKADNSDKHLLHLNGMASGMYTLGIITDQGTVIRKLELLR